jgi:hypothetical protein
MDIGSAAVDGTDFRVCGQDRRVTGTSMCPSIFSITREMPSGWRSLSDRKEDTIFPREPASTSLENALAAGMGLWRITGLGV